MPQQKIQKPWGFEIVLTENNLPYVSKIAFTRAGCRWSLQYHLLKIETITLLSGKAQLLLGPDADNLRTIDLISSTGYTVEPNMVHRLIAITDCVTVEASMPETDTTVRIQDDYSRPNESKDIRMLPNRGWNPPTQ